MNKEIEKAIKQLESLKLDRESFLENDKEHDEIYLKDIQAIETVLNYIKELEEDKKITELTKISCCTAQNCGALENAIKEGLENDKLKKDLADSTPNSVIREKIKELKNKSGGNVFHIQQTINAEIRLLEEILKEGEK